MKMNFKKLCGIVACFVIACLMVVAVLAADDAGSSTGTQPVPCAVDDCTGSYENGICTACGGYEAPETGDGTADDPYIIKNAGQLYWFAQQVNSGNTSINARPTKNITVNPGSFDASGNYTAVADETVRDWIPIGTSEHPFTGSFKSLGGYTISGLYFNDSTADHVGLFGCVGNGAKINAKINDEGAAEANGSIWLKNSYIHARNNVGGIVGGTVDGKDGNAVDVNIFQCNIKENVTIVGNENVGGIVGCNMKGTVTACGVSKPATVSGTGNYVGGIAGYSTGRIESSSIDYTKVSGSQYVGGIAGDNGGTVTDCAVYGTISGECFVGGAVGNNTGTVQKISSMTGVTATGITAANGTISFAGGIVGYNNGGTVEDCVSIKAVTGSGTQYVGGIVGCNDNNAVLKNSYSACEVSGDSYVGAVLGFNQSGTVTNCYYTDYYGVMDDSDTPQYGIGAEKGKTSADVTGMTEGKSLDQFNSGEVTYLLNGGVTDGTQVWYQTCGNGYNGFSGKTVYYGYDSCASSAKAYYTNDSGKVSVEKPSHNGVTTSNGNNTHSVVCTVCKEVVGEANIACTFDEDYFCTVCYGEHAHTKGTDGFCTVCGRSATKPAQDEKGVYLIYTAPELYWFAEQVNRKYGAQTEISAKLMADITVNSGKFDENGGYTVNGVAATPRPWTPIANGSADYYASFDGNGKTVSGLYCNQTYGNVGFLARVSAFEVKDLHIANSYFAGNYAGAIIGYTDGTTVECCSAAADVYVKGNNYAGGIVGYNCGTIKNCYSFAKIAENGSWGGLAGYNYGTIKNSFTTAMQPAGYSYGDGMDNVFYGKDTRDYITPDEGGYVTQKPTFQGATEVTDSTDFTSGEIAWKLQDGVEETPAKGYWDYTNNEDGEWVETTPAYIPELWGQTLGTDGYPTLGGAKVYKMINDGCPYADDKFSNTENEHFVGEHDYDDDGFCKRCDAYQAPAGSGTEASPYLIANAGNLYWFAAQVNSGSTSINAKLTKNITVNSGVLKSDGTLNTGGFRAWTPIGNGTSSSEAYKGTFDGDGHTISGLYYNGSDQYVGLFGYIEGGAVIQNVSVIDSRFQVSGESAYLGGIVGHAWAYANAGSITISNCSSAVLLASTANNVRAGGVVGEVWSNGETVTIQNCSNIGDITASTSGYNYCGGVAGNVYSYNGSVVIQNCSNTGDITVTSTLDPNYSGGMAGYVYSDNGSVTIQNCFNTGELSATSTSSKTYCGGVAGNVYSANGSVTIQNCFNTGELSATSSSGNTYCGGMAGYVYSANGSVTIQNCFNTGELSATSSSGNTYCGGVAGYVYSDNGSATIQNCFNTGLSETSTSGNTYCGGVAGYAYAYADANDKASVVLFNCYYTSANAYGDKYVIGDGAEVTIDKCATKTAAQFASGEVTWLLNGDRASGTVDDPIVWYQIIGVQSCPGFTGSTVSRAVDGTYYNDAAVAGYTLYLEGKIGVNFYTLLSESFRQSTNAKLVFTLPNGTQEIKALTDASTVDRDGKTYYVFTCYVAAHEMTSAIKLECYIDDELVTADTITIRDYAMYIINNPTAYAEADVTFAKALLNYGAASQAYFGVKTDDLANKALSVDDQKITQPTVAQLEAYKLTGTYSGALGTFTGTSLYLDSATSLRAYFEPAEGVEIGDITFTVTAGSVIKEVTAVKTANGYMLAYDGLMAYELGDNVTFTATRGEQSVSFTCSAMTYAYNVISRPTDTTLYTEELKTLVSALYNYMNASKAYGGTNNAE